MSHYAIALRRWELWDRETGPFFEFDCLRTGDELSQGYLHFTGLLAKEFPGQVQEEIEKAQRQDKGDAEFNLENGRAIAPRRDLTEDEAVGYACRWWTSKLGRSIQGGPWHGAPRESPPISRLPPVTRMRLSVEDVPPHQHYLPARHTPLGVVEGEQSAATVAYRTALEGIAGGARVGYWELSPGELVGFKAGLRRAEETRAAQDGFGAIVNDLDAIDDEERVALIELMSESARKSIASRKGFAIPNDGWKSHSIEERFLHVVANQAVTKMALPVDDTRHFGYPGVTCGRDFTWISVGREKFYLKKGQHSAIVRFLYEEWARAGGDDRCGLTEETLGDFVGATSSFAVRKILPKSPDLNRLLHSPSSGVWGLRLRQILEGQESDGPQDAPVTPE